MEVKFKSLLIFLLFSMCSCRELITKYEITYYNGEKEEFTKTRYFIQDTPYIDEGCIYGIDEGTKCGVRNFKEVKNGEM